jgi:hypothetical protein
MKSFYLAIFVFLSVLHFSRSEANNQLCQQIGIFPELFKAKLDDLKRQIDDTMSQLNNSMISTVQLVKSRGTFCKFDFNVKAATPIQAMSAGHQIIYSTYVSSFNAALDAVQSSFGSLVSDANKTCSKCFSSVDNIQTNLTAVEAQAFKLVLDEFGAFSTKKMDIAQDYAKLATGYFVNINCTQTDDKYPACIDPIVTKANADLKANLAKRHVNLTKKHVNEVSAAVKKVIDAGAADIKKIKPCKA